MSYVVTPRKWRPRFFRDVVSQHHVTETLKNAIKSGRVGHAYLFSGPRGVGKTTVARIFAKALNCLRGPAEEPCNECENCLSIQAGTSMDIQELDGASNNTVDDVRNLIAGVGYHASRCRYKMYIIDEVHMLSTQAFNALLKTLEEPPANVIFIFATTEPHRIPATILSRCQRFDFHRLSIRDIAGKLKKIADTDGIDIDEASITLIAQRAGGAMRDAESILEQLKSSRGGSITVADVTEVLGIADRNVFFDVIERCHEKDAFGAIELFRTYYDEGGDLKEFVEGLLSHLRDMLYARYDKGLEYVMLDDGMKARVKEQSEWYAREDIIRMIGITGDVETSLAYSVLPALRIEVALARMAAMDETVRLRELFERLGGESARDSGEDRGAALPSGTAGGVRADTTAEEETKARGGKPEPPVSPGMDSILAAWEEILDEVRRRKPHVGPSLIHATPVSFENGRLKLVFKPEHTFHCKAVESNAEPIEEIIGSLVGGKVVLACEAGGGAGERTAASGGKNGEVDDLIAREPIIKDILERFGGEINGIWRE